MAILQKLETSYLAILRFVVIAISGILLIATLALLATALADLREGATPEQHSPKVEPERVITELTRVQPKPDAPAVESPAPGVRKQTDPNHAHYERTADVIAPFVGKYGKGHGLIRNGMLDILKEQAEKQPTLALVEAYASGLPDFIEKVLSDKKVIELVSRPIWAEPGDGLSTYDAAVGRSPFWVIGKALDQYFAMFSEQVEQAAENEEKERVAKAVRKEQAMQNLYLAAAVFGAFLMLALLSIIVRVERNLRPLAHLADKAGAAE